MSDENDPSRPPGRGEPGTTRRTLVRSAANAAWAVPLVSVATAAPARAATSVATSLALRVDVATFFLWTFGPYTCLTPMITVTNPTTQSTDSVSVILQFSTSDFTGANTFLTPPTPSYVDLGSVDPSWTVSTLGTGKGDTVVSVRLRRALGLAALETSIVAGAVNRSVPFGICFANKPTVTSVPIQVQATGGFDIVPWTMSKVDPPS